MINDASVREFVQWANQSGRPAHQTYMRLVCHCLDAVMPALPQIAVNAYSTARAYWLRNEGSAPDLDQAQRACWEYLQSIGSSTKLDSPAVISVRAVICALYAEPSDEDFDSDTLDWFVVLLNKLGDYSAAFAKAFEAVRG